MLKIKDNVDLKELEKFGFNTYSNNADNYHIYENIERTKDCEYGILINDYFDDNNKTIGYYFNNIEPINDVDNIDNLDKKSLDILYDLIKADLVEKVEDK